MSAARDAWVEVRLGAVAENVRALKALTRPGTLFMAVVKAGGYGHGAVPVAQTALAAGADRLGVSTVEEALELRRAGIVAPLHVFAEPPLSAASVVVEHKLIPTVATLGFARALAAASTSAGTRARYHLKVDSGMNRIGVRAEDAPEFARELRPLAGLEMEGVFTHFATADVPGDWGFDRQIARFTQATEDMRTEGIDPGIIHAANSAATILHPRTHFDMVRCGISIYGLHPDRATHGRVDLRPAMSVKARVTFLKRVPLGEGVSYGFTYHTSAPTVLATLPLGYADGVHRAASNKMRVLMDGIPCRQVGRVCMDQLVVEVPRDVTVSIGDEAVLVGEQAGQRIGMEELADHAGTIDYEIACAFAMRLPRRYL